MSTPPTQAQVVVIGGGIIGCSTAYHLAKNGWTDVVILERAKLTSGSTWHAAGLVGQLRSSANITQLLKYSVQLYDNLEAETGQATGWKMNGGLRLACNADRLTEIKRQATMARSFGLEMHLLSPSEARDLWPIMDASDLVGAAFLPTDGQANPSDTAQALARGARQAGVKIIEDCPVDAIQIRDGRVTGVSTPQGDVACEVAVNCAGQWAREVGHLAGVNVPLCSMQHQYMITERIADVPTDLPTLRDPDRLIYFKEDVGGLVMGGYEPNPIPWAEDGIPQGFHFSLLDSDWGHFGQLMEQALERVPALENAGIKQLLNGPESFTPDGNFILGEAPEVAGFYIGAGFNAFGIAGAGGAGRALAEWIVGGAAPMDLSAVDILRFGPPHHDIDWVRERTVEACAKHYTMGWPHEEASAGRPRRVSPLYDKLKASRACFGSKLGWERVNWFARPGEEPQDIYAFGRQNWFDAVGEEHRACRETAALFDASSFAKYLVTGRDAERALGWICSNDVSGAPGKVTYTQMLNGRGGIECDLTVSRLDETTYYIVTGTGFATHDADWIRRNIPDDADATLSEITDDMAVLTLMGPNARDVLGAVTDSDLDNDAFPFGACREITIAGRPVRAIRVTYVGELGWELHMPAEAAPEVFDTLTEAGQAYGLRLAGYRAIESLRLEKGYRAWGSDIGPDYTPVEAGMAWALKLKSNIDFQGRDQVARQAANGIAKRLACFTVDESDVVLLGRETIYRNGERVGWLSSAGWGYTVGSNIGYGYVRHEGGVDAAFLKDGDYQLEVATQMVPAQLHMKALYDPSNTRVKT